MVLITWAKTATPSDDKRARRSLRASLPFPQQLLPCTSVVQQLPPLLFPPPNSKQPWPKESATPKAVDNFASPRLHTPALQEALPRSRGCRSKKHPPKIPSRTAPVAPPYFMPPLPSQPPFSLPSTALPSLGLIPHPLVSGYGPPYTSITAAAPTSHLTHLASQLLP